MLLAYNPGKAASSSQGQASFWDVRRFPDKCGLRQGVKYSLEFALMADSVAPENVYQTLVMPAGVERVFRKLDELKPYIHRWRFGRDPVRDLTNGIVVMSSAYNRRVVTVQAEKQRLAMVWSGGIYDFDFQALPVEVREGQLAEEFIRFAGQPERQKALVENIAYGLANHGAVDLPDLQVTASLPTAPQNVQNVVGMNVAFWVEHDEALKQRFQNWAKR